MEDQDKRTEEQEDVEGHGKKSKFVAQASEDAPDETEGEEDFELHRKTPKAL